MSTKSVDDLLVKVENAKLSPTPIPPAAPIEVQHNKEAPQDEKPIAKPQPDENAEAESQDESEAPTSDVYGESSDKKEAVSDDQDASAEDVVDAYGEKPGKSKVYTEDEVQKMIRDRLQRGRYAEESPANAVPATPPPANAKPVEGEGQWEEELDRYIDKRLESKEREKAEKLWQKQEQEKQVEFESKFTTGMNRYSDFKEVVQGKPITNAIMLAARTLDDPAAFIYAASKNHEKDLQRIAALPDAYQQATEIGRLEAKMRKRAGTTKASKPAQKISSDVASKGKFERPSIDAMIQQHGQQKMARGR